LEPSTTPDLAESARALWSFSSGTAECKDEQAQPDVRSEARGEWKTSAPGSRWLGDLEEKLDQLAIYRAKSPPDESAIASLLLDIGRIGVERHQLQPAFEALHEAEQTFARLGNRRQLSSAKTWLSR